MSGDFLADAGVLMAVSLLAFACGLGGFGMGFAMRGQLEKRREKRVNAAVQGSLCDVTGPALYARTKGEPFTNVLKRHEREARRAEQ